MIRGPYGISSPDRLSDLEYELIAFKRVPPPQVGGLGKERHFWNIIAILWGKGSPKEFIRHPWAERMVKYACEHDYLGVLGCGCVVGSTRILNPVTGEQPTIQELCETGTVPVVMTMKGPALATVPFLKGREDIYRVRLRNGTSFESTAAHRVLAPHGFVHVSDLRPGSLLLGYEPLRQVSTSDTGLSIHARDVRRSLRKAEDFQFDYQFSPCSYDEQLLQEEGNDQSLVPSPTDAQEHMVYAYGHEDDQGSTHIGIRPYQYARRPSIESISHGCVPCSQKHESPLPVEETLLRDGDLFRQPFPFSLGMLHPPLTSSEEDRGSEYRQLISTYGDYRVSHVEVSSITKTGYKYFYDLQVPFHHHYFAEGSIHHNSSGKTDWAAVWGIVNWLCAPEDTLVLVTSTSLKDSRKRIWGSVTAYFQAAGRLPGKLVDSMGTIRTMNEAGEANNDKQGIALLAGEKKKEKEAIGKMIGMKNKRVFLIADELPELSEAILEAAYSNLALNPYFQLIGIGNFNSLYDPLGVFVRPKAGYGSITPDDEEWETERGYCIRFDGLKSPNILDGEDKWPIYTTKKLAAHRASLGENSAAFWRMCRSFPCPEGEENCIYSEADFVRGNAHGSVNWLYEPTPVVAADPAFTNGGDRFAVVYGLYGTSATGVATLAITGIDYLYENVSLTAHGEPRDFQTARMLVDRSSAKGIARENLACDCSGPGGLAYGSILTTLWGHRFHPVKFGEAPSNRAVSIDDPKSCKDSFYNKASELWFTGKNFIRNGHIKTLPVEIAKELKSRFYTTVKSGDNLKMKIEPKPDMKARVRMSPDISDAFLMLVDLCRERFDFIAGTGEQRKLTNQSWIDKVKKRNSVYDPELSYADTAR